MLLTLGKGLSPVCSGSLKGGIGSSAFTPLDIELLKLWLDASDTSTVTHIAGAVSQWDDKSGNDNHVTQGTGSAQPATGTRTTNGRNVLDFAGSRYLNIPSGLFSVPGDANTIFIVYENDAAASTKPLFQMTEGGVRRYHLEIEGAFDNFRVVHSTSGAFDFRSLDIGTDNDAGLHVLGFTFDTGPELYMFHDGSTHTATYSTVGANASIDGGRIAGDVSSGAFWDGAIAEILIYGKTLTPEELNLTGQYFADKWGITWTDI